MRKGPLARNWSGSDTSDNGPADTGITTFKVLSSTPQQIMWHPETTEP